MKTYLYPREEYQARFQAAQAEVAEFQATGMLNDGAHELLAKLPPVEQIADDRVRTCVSVDNHYNHTLVAIANAVSRRAKNRQEVDGFCGLWHRNGGHDPYNSNIRKLLLGSIWKRIANSEAKPNDLKHAIHWFYYQVKTLVAIT